MQPSSPLHSLPPSSAERGNRRWTMGRTSGTSFLPEFHRPSRSDCGPRRRRRLFPAGPHPRAAPGRCACALSPSPRRPEDVRTFPSRLPGTEMRGTRARASSRCVRRSSGTRVWEGATPGKGRPCLGPSQVPGAPERGPHDLSSFAFPSSRPPDWGAGISEKKAQKLYFPCSGSYHMWHFPSRCSQSSFHPCLSFPGVGFSSLWILARFLGAYQLWKIGATTSCQGPVSFADAHGNKRSGFRAKRVGRLGKVGQKKLRRGKGCDKCRQRSFSIWKLPKFLSVLAFLAHLFLCHPHFILMMFVRTGKPTGFQTWRILGIFWAQFLQSYNSVSCC